MTSMCCIRCVVYSSLETDFKSTFIGLHAVFKFFMRFSSCHMQHTQRMHGLQRNQKTEIRNACTQKTQRIQSIVFFACIALFMCMHCIAFDSLETDL